MHLGREADCRTVRAPIFVKVGLPLLVVSMTLSLLALACTYEAPAGNVVSQQLTWFSYLSGDDIRAQCADGASDRYRLIYNADRVRQARAYDIWDVREGAVVEQMVDRGILLESGRPIDASLIGVPVRARNFLSLEEFDHLEALLQASGAFEPPPVGLRLNSRSHYWIVSGCRDGAFFLTGYRYPSDRYDRLRFPSFLEARDRTGVAYPRLPTPTQARWVERCPRGNGTTLDNPRCYWIEVGEDGLVGITTLN